MTKVSGVLPDRDDDGPYPTSSKVESEMSLSRTMKLAHAGSMRQTISVSALSLSVYAVLYSVHFQRIIFGSAGLFKSGPPIRCISPFGHSTSTRNTL